MLELIVGLGAGGAVAVFGLGQASLAMRHAHAVARELHAERAAHRKTIDKAGRDRDEYAAAAAAEREQLRLELHGARQEAAAERQLLLDRIQHPAQPAHGLLAWPDDQPGALIGPEEATERARAIEAELAAREQQMDEALRSA